MASLSAGVFPDAVEFVTHLLESGRRVIDTALSPFGIRLRGIYSFYSEAIGFEDMPCVLLEDESVESEWHAIPLIAEERYRIRLWGYVYHEEPAQRRGLMLALGRSVQGVLNRTVAPITYEGVQYFWTGTMVPAVSFGIGFVGNSVVAAFTATCEIMAEVSYVD